MSKEMSFLKSIENSGVDFDFELEQEDGSIRKLEIPLEWFYSKNITRETFEQTLRELLEEEIEYREKNGSKNTLEGYKYKARQKHPENPEEIQEFKVLKDENGHTYLEVAGKDEWSKLLIHQDGMYLSRRDGYKIPESVLIEKVKQITDRKKVEEFIKSQGGNVNLENLDMKKMYELISKIQETDAKDDLEVAGKDISSYADYIRQELVSQSESTIRCEVAEDTVGPRGPRKGKTPAHSRVNDVIDSDVRFDFLKSLHPQYTINVNPLKEDDEISYQFKAFVYDLQKKNEGETGKMIIIEPKNGTSYTRNVYISESKISEIYERLVSERKEDETITQMQVYEEIIAETLAKTRLEGALDSKMQQTSHTNENAFKANCRYFVSKDKEGLEGSVLYKRVSDRQRMLEEK